MSHFRKYYSPSTLNSSNASSTSASTPSTVIQVGPTTTAESSSENVQVSTDPNPLPSTHLSSTVSAFRGQSTNRGALPTSNFLINRHKLLRKTEEGKVMREGGTLSGSRSQLTGSSSNLAHKPKEFENYGANGKSFVEDEDRHASTDTSRYDDSAGNITETDFSERSAVSRIPVGNVEYGGNERPIEHVTSQNFETDSEAPRAVSSVRWSPSSSSRPQVPPKPDISSNELERKMEEIAAKSKQSRGILRVPSLRGTLTRSRTPSRGPSEERPAKKKEEYLHESVTYTKTKAPAEVPVSSAAPSSGRANFFRGRSGNTVTSSSSSRAEVSSPQLLNTTTDQVGSAVEIGGTSRRISPSPQRTSIIPAPIQTGTVQTANLSLRETDRPVDVETIVQIAPVYSRLSDVRSAPKQTTRIQQMMESSRPAVPSPTPSGFIQPQIRPTPPRKPVRTDVNETLIEVLPQGKARRPAPPVPAVNHRAATAGRSEQHVTTIRTSSPSPTRAGHLSTVANLSRNTSPTHGVTVPVNNHNNVGHDAARPIQRIESAPKSINDSYAGQMTFDDEFDSLMSSSHVDYEHSSADEDDDLVKRSLMKASGNRRGNIENIEEENITTTYVDNAPTVYRTEFATHSQSHYDKLPQRHTRTVVQRKPSFLSSADDSDSSRGQGNLAGSNVRSSVTTTRVSRRESDVNQADAQLPRDDSAGRRKYDERRQLLRSFEENLQRKRHQSAKDDDRFTQSNQNGPPRNTQQPHHIYRQTG
ncbi:hypothetical protein RvY_13803-2 [Ramazzottius varieornatus]|nr:hypothetical protein RvY_13803-2 [Ramazzottius varieornatus]